MNDKEILARLAEIEGKPKFPRPDLYWNPLKYWRDCGPLIERHNVDIFDAGTAEIWHIQNDGSAGDLLARVYDPNLKRAICLAIIEAHY